MKNWTKILLRTASYVLVAVLTALICFRSSGKLQQLQYLLENRYIGNADRAAMEDAAAKAMVASLGDRWSYYIPAADYETYQEGKRNAYVGIGITISQREDEKGFDIVQVQPGGAAQMAGILPGDILTEVEGQPVCSLGTEGTRELIRGEAGTDVSVSVLRDGETLSFTLTRSTVRVAVATGQMLGEDIGLVTIANFNENCAQETIKAIEELKGQGAKALIFDVRNNPGGYLLELTKLLDYLLPEGVIFRSVDYTGKEDIQHSDADCLQMPMAVLVNGESYSAAEFFAAALEEYDWAVTAGTQTCGKGYFQTTYRLSDGSAVGLSVGKYYTPEGISLAETGGLTPQIITEVDERTEALIYAKTIQPENDPQLQAAIEALQKEN
ncbi:MAG: PDZ domain-containing protein [Oscillospiraceae bacterium]|nr:PDZ domain-containing protein [Oscillospiraceae bacterium]